MKGDRPETGCRAGPAGTLGLQPSYVDSLSSPQASPMPLAGRAQPSTKTPVSLQSPQVAVLTYPDLLALESAGKWEKEGRRKSSPQSHLVSGLRVTLGVPLEKPEPRQAPIPENYIYLHEGEVTDG